MGINKINTSSSRTCSFGKSFAKRTTSTECEIHSDISFAEETYLRALQYAKETISVYQALYMLDGAISTETYNQIVEDIKKNIKELKERLNQPSYTLVIVKDGYIQKPKSFIHSYTLVEYVNQLMCPQNPIITLDHLLSNNQQVLPQQYRGTQIFKEDWILHIPTALDALKAGS